MDWSEAREAVSPVRFAVFVGEQGVPAEIELDEHDAASVHAVARDAAGNVVGTGRLLPDGHVGRMAVLKSWRRRGVGSRILEALMTEARRRGHRAVVLSAQVRAVDFYRRHGFAPEGGAYEEAGILHQDMRRLFPQS